MNLHERVIKAIHEARWHMTAEQIAAKVNHDPVVINGMLHTLSRMGHVHKVPSKVRWGVISKEGKMTDPLDELMEVLREAVATDRDDILEREHKLPDNIKAEITQALEAVREILDPNSNEDNRPIVERMIAARCHLGVLIASLSGTTLAEMMESELEMARVAEAMAAVVTLQEAMRKIMGADDGDSTNGSN